MDQLFYINSGRNDETIDEMLCMRIGEHHYSFALTDKSGSELYSLGYYSANDMNAAVLGEIFSRHSELRDSVDQVQVSYDYSSSTLVPHPFDHGREAGIFLHTMFGSMIGSNVLTEPLADWQVSNIYAVPSDIQELISRIFPSHKYRHHYTIAIGMMSPDPADHILIELNKDEFSYILVKENKLQIAQTRYYSSPEDILYYLLKTCNQFSLSREDVQLFISGLIEKESQLFRELYLNFLNIQFREPTWKQPPNGEREYPAHFFTSLNDLARCAS